MTKEKFEALPADKKRVEIAKDVIKALNKDRIIAATGNYFRSEDMFFYLNKVGESQQLQELLPKYQCTVCAKGALFVADVAKTNNFTVDSRGIADYRMMQKLEYFEEGQLNLIETAFEGAIYYRKGLTDEYDNLIDAVYQAYDFYKKNNKNPAERMVAIMQNIIKNKGEFKP